MSINLSLQEYMKEDALIFDNISKAICDKDNKSYDSVLKECNQFENKTVLFSILPTYYVMKTILYFKLNDYDNAHKYINGSLKYLLYVAKTAQELSLEEQKNFNEYKENVLNQYKILTQDKPEYQNTKKVSLPSTVKFIINNDTQTIEKEQNIRFLMRKDNINRESALALFGV